MKTSTKKPKLAVVPQQHQTNHAAIMRAIDAHMPIATTNGCEDDDIMHAADSLERAIAGIEPILLSLEYGVPRAADFMPYFDAVRARVSKAREVIADLRIRAALEEVGELAGSLNGKDAAK